MLTVVQLVLVVIVLMTRNVVDALERGQRCVDPAGRMGNCVKIQECQSLNKLNSKSMLTNDDITILTASRCGGFGGDALVCCACFPEPPICGFQITDRLIGGGVTKLSEFPWTALIVYMHADGSTAFYCGGALINEEYVLTAAHCVVSLRKGWKVHRVRLGEWDLSTSVDCSDDSCADPVIDMDIDDIIVHSEHDDLRKANDIALIRLRSRVEYCVTIQPICLPISEEIRLINHEGMTAYAAGWGRTENGTSSDRKRSVPLPISNLENCTNEYQDIDFELLPTHLCAGGENGKDSCSGDSGGPLMRLVHGSWYLLGVVSFGLKSCGTQSTPSVYSNVAEYMDWIRNKVN